MLPGVTAGFGLVLCSGPDVAAEPVILGFDTPSHAVSWHANDFVLTENIYEPLNTGKGPHALPAKHPHISRLLSFAAAMSPGKQLG